MNVWTRLKSAFETELKFPLKRAAEYGMVFLKFSGFIFPSFATAMAH